MATYVLLVGAPGAGKSIVAGFLKGHMVSPDGYRDTLGVDIQTAYDMARQEIPRLLQTGEDVILDATNAYREKRRGMIQVGRPYADQVVCIWLDTPWRVCVARHRDRLAWMREMKARTARYDEHPEVAFESLVRQQCDEIATDPPSVEDGFDKIIRIVP